MFRKQLVGMEPLCLFLCKYRQYSLCSLGKSFKHWLPPCKCSMHSARGAPVNSLCAGKFPPVVHDRQFAANEPYQPALTVHSKSESEILSIPGPHLNVHQKAG